MLTEEQFDALSVGDKLVLLCEPLYEYSIEHKDENDAYAYDSMMECYNEANTIVSETEVVEDGSLLGNTCKIMFSDGEEVEVVDLISDASNYLSTNAQDVEVPVVVVGFPELWLSKGEAMACLEVL